MGRKCSIEDCGSASRAIYPDPTKKNETRHRCLECIPDSHRSKLQMGSYELTILNDIIPKIKKLHPELRAIHDKTFIPGKTLRPDLLYEIKDGYVVFEIDEAGHNSAAQKAKDDEKSKIFREYAKSQKKKYYEIRIVVNEDDTKGNAMAEGAGLRGTPVFKIKENYDRIIDLAVHKFENANNGSKNKNLKIDQVKTKEFDNLLKSFNNINIDEKKNSDACEAMVKSTGKKCTALAKAKGCCGRHQK